MNSSASQSDAFRRLDGDRAGGLLLLCDHASNHVPPPYGDLGLPASQFARHIGYDIGAANVTERLAELSGAPALLTCYSRLLIDPNRGEDDPTLVMRLSDGAVVPGNAKVDEAERQRRIDHFHRPYHAAIAEEIDAMMATGKNPAIVSIHSFTPIWKSWARPWEIAILWDRDPRLSVPLIERLRRSGELTIGDNEPYDGALRNDTLYRHATGRGLSHTLIEVRQDLIADRAGADLWADRLWSELKVILSDPAQHEVCHFRSRAD